MIIFPIFGKRNAKGMTNPGKFAIIIDIMGESSANDSRRVRQPSPKAVMAREAAP